MVRTRRVPAATVVALLMLAVLPGAATARAFGFRAPSRSALDFCAPADRECVRVVVPIDRSGQLPGTVSLQVERQRAHQSTRPPLFLIAGGPGESATRSFAPPDVSAILGSGQGGRDVIVVDLRGTGDSGALSCPALARAQTSTVGPAVTSCAASLGPRRAFYTTRDNVADLEAVRQAIGAPTIALLGVSYGSQVALAYARTHPDHVDRVIVDSIVPLDGPDPLLRSSFLAAPRVMGSFCAEVGCRAVTHNAAGDVMRLARELAQHPLRSRTFDGFGRPHGGSASGIDLLGVIIAGDLDPGERAAVPGAINNALRGDGAPLVRLADTLSAGPAPDPKDLSVATNTATSCEEQALPWVRTATPAVRAAQARQVAFGLPSGAFGAFGPATAILSPTLQICLNWPAAPTPPSLGPTSVPTAPILLISGQQDARTPFEDARKVAAALPGAKLVIAPGLGHSVIGTDPSGCWAAMVRRFLAGLAVAACPAPSMRLTVRTYPLSLHEVRPSGRVPGAAGRTLAAVPSTVADVLPSIGELIGAATGGQSTFRVGGLRGGSATWIDSSSTLLLRHLTFIPGVTITGRLRHFDSAAQIRGALRIGGRAAARGVLTVNGKTVTGQLGGHPVRATVALDLFDLLQR